MEVGSTEFWLALLQIIWVNIILSGDNAVVIALACRSLPPRQQKWGIILGAGAAVLLRVIFVLIISYLLELPYLKIIGGLLLFWIGYKLMMPEEGEGHGVEAGSNLMRAVTIVLWADLVMSLDNVIAIAAAARNDTLLIVIGLAISVPMVVFGATLMIKLLQRFPILVTLGAALIGYIGGEVVVTDFAVIDWVDANAHWLHWVGPAAGAIFVVAYGRWMARRARERVAAASTDLARE
ncbi:MAG TPA: TerC family protein [Alphaproteobacteria bacterium]|nr:TerC family protein [Alphaproteobacteria bacterium]